MPSAKHSFLNSITAISRAQIQQAGSRYTPGIDPKAPNIRHASLFAAIQNVACGADAAMRFRKMLDGLNDAWQKAKHGSQRAASIDTHLAAARDEVSVLLPRLRSGDQKAASDWIARITLLDTALSADVLYWRAEDTRLSADPVASRDSTARDRVRSTLRALERCSSAVREEMEYTTSPAFRLLSDPLLLITGEWGTGKTHLLCDVTQDRLAGGKGTVLVLAKNFEGPVVQSICSRIHPGSSPSDVLTQLDSLGHTTGERALIIVDGINEGRRREWKAGAHALRTLVSAHPHVGLIITCRTPFESVALLSDDLSAFHQLTHDGFEDVEFDAQAAFFSYYGLPLPEVPLLDNEFARPLTLKLICQSLQNLTTSKLAKGFAGIASGQRGMTYVLESFVNNVGQPIEQANGLRTKGCWGLLKGSDQITDRKRAGFAPCMAVTGRDYVRRADADRIIASNYPGHTPAARRRLLEAMRTSGLIDEDVVWYSSKGALKSRIVLRLPYQRFSDHLVARHLLKNFLDTRSATAIRRSFSAGSPLGRVFRQRSRHSREFQQPGWAQALIAEFPERAGTRLPPRQRELFFVLPKGAQDLGAYFEPFVEGLFWRSPSAFTSGTRLILNEYLNASQSAWERIVDSLAAVSTKSKHPYHARRLYRFLASSSMPERDLSWSEYLRRDYASPTIRRLLTWARDLDNSHVSEDTAKDMVVLLSLVLTTVVRSDRDVVTKALVILGEKYPDVLFARALDSLAFNDPYMPERLLAAAYGVTLSLVDSDNASAFRQSLGRLALALYRRMFAQRARHATHHTLMRDYALGIIEVARSAGCVTLPKMADRHIAPPYPHVPSSFLSDGVPDPEVTGEVDSAIHMDFGNYTIGGLVPGRANYNSDHPEYVSVRAKIERRMFDLGYRKDRFAALDSSIGSASFYQADSHKVDRYGKKYSWIAYFEMWGEREANGCLPDWKLGERTADCGIDPSFPKAPREWSPPLPDLFGELGSSVDDWVGGDFVPDWRSLQVVPEINEHQGDWVLLEGFVRGEDSTAERELFGFLRGLFVTERDVRRLRGKFRAVSYPGNHAIPEGASEHVLYGGEAGRRQNYARHLLGRDGRYRRQIDEAFERYVSGGAFRIIEAVVDRSQGTAVDDDVEDVVFQFKGVPRPARRIPGIRVEVPCIHYSWASDQSEVDSARAFDLPAPSLIQRLGLFTRNREMDFWDTSGKPAILYRRSGSGWKGDSHHLLYIRSDLLRRYLTATRQVLVWCNWGERNWLRHGASEMTNDPTRQRILQEYRHIHRSFSRWRGEAT